MRILTSLLFVIIVFFFAVSCEKQELRLYENTLPGTWKYSGSSFSAGGPQEFHPAPKSNTDYIEFKPDGTFNGPVLSDYVSYLIKDSVTITLSRKDYTIQNYRYTIKNGELIMGPAGPIVCMEGCSTSFIKVKADSSL